jgi:hypothetical protein
MPAIATIAPIESPITLGSGTNGTTDGQIANRQDG